MLSPTMTYTEAAIEILRRAGKPLHFKAIAADAVAAGILSHVGQTPEATMGARLLALARREHDRKVVATDTGIFALAEWGLALTATGTEGVLEPTPDDTAPAYRARERHPPVQDEVLVGGRREERRRRGDGDDEDGKRKKRYAPPAEVAHQWLRERGQPATLAELATGLRVGDKIAEALERDLHSLERALQEENRRRTDTNRSPLFQFEENGTVRALDQQKEAARERLEKPARVEKPRREREEAPKPAGADEQRKGVIRSIRRRLGGLDAASLERVVTAFLETTGYRELNMARRSPKEGPLYLARRKWGAGELRYVVRALKPGREVGRTDVQEVRRDLTHYSAQIGIVIGSGECSRDAKSEANIPSVAPVMLYGNEALAEALVDAGLAVTKKLVEWLEYDDSFFTSAGASEEMPPPLVETETPAPAPAPVPVAADAERDDRSRRPRDRRRERRPREGGEGEERSTEQTEAPEAGANVVPPPPEAAAPPSAEVVPEASNPSPSAESASEVPPPVAESRGEEASPGAVDSVTQTAGPIESASS